ALFASEVSPVSDISACTREPLRFRQQVGEHFMTIVDLPGVGEHFYYQIIGEAYRHKVLFVISQSDKVEPTSSGETLSTKQKQN
ncbi:hypothetical protein J8803_29570, partial [Klebsiella pneumoniae]